MDLTSLQKEIESNLKKLSEQHQELASANEDNPPEVMMEFIKGVKDLYQRALDLQQQRSLQALEKIEKTIAARYATLPPPQKVQPVHVESLLTKSSLQTPPPQPPVQEVIQVAEQTAVPKPAPSHPSMDELLLAAANKAAAAKNNPGGTGRKKVITDIHDRFDEVPTLAGKFNDQDSIAKRMAGSKTQTGVAEKLQRKPISDLKAAICTNEKFLFINHLFSGDAPSYNLAIELLNKSANLESAKSYIYQDLIIKYDWDATTHPATLFIDLVERRFIS